MANDTYPARNLGELIDTVYEEFLTLYGDKELASVATAAVIYDLLHDADGKPNPTADEPS